MLGTEKKKEQKRAYKRGGFEVWSVGKQ